MTVRTTGLLAAALASGLLLSACSDDSNSTDPQAGGGEATSDSSSTQASGGIECFSGTLMASGSSAQDNAMQAWISEFQGECSDATVNYQAVGSGAGIEAFLAGTTAFAGSDAALQDDEVGPAEQRCEGGTPINLPMVIGPIAVAYNLPDVDQLVLDAPTIAQIFAGEITTWDDQAIADLNPDAQLPSIPIRAVHRSDSSGTTANFTSYLGAAAPDAWTFGDGKAWMAPGGEGAAQSSGVTQAVQSSEGAVTYVESSFAENAELSIAMIDTGGGEPVELTPEAAAQAIAAAEVVGTAPDLALEIDYATSAEGAYPIVLATYEITCSTGLPEEQATQVQSFLDYTSSEAGQQVLNDLSYAPLPDELRTQVSEAVSGISAG